MANASLPIPLLQNSGMLSREQLVHLFHRFSFITSQPDAKQRIQDAVKNKQEPVSVTTAIQEEIFLELGIDPSFGIACLQKVSATYESDMDLMIQFYKFVSKEEMACDEAELDAEEFSEKLHAQQQLQDQGIAAEGYPFVGVLYAGLMIEKKSGLPKLIEYNVRFGDLECQVLMARLELDLVQVLLAACKGQLGSVSLEWSPESAMVVVMASRGYPGNYEKGSIIRNIEEAEHMSPTVKVFHAGTSINLNGDFIGEGGRVLGVTKGKDIEEARRRAHDAVEEIDWPEGFYRHDIGLRALSRYT